MKVSVIINNYNYGRFLPECLDSVLKQTYKNYEIIIVDDGSTDDSKQIILNYEQKYPKLIKALFKENGGQASAFNEGFKLAKGEIICFLDSDDYWFENKLEIIVSHHKYSDIVEHSNIIANNSCRWLPCKINSQEDLIKYGRIKRFAETSAISFKKELLEKIFPIPLECRICADSYVITACVYFTDKISTVNQVLSYYRVHDNNNWYNNPNADRNYYKSFVYLLNESLINKQLPPIPIGKYFYYKNIVNLKLDSNKKYAIYGTGELGYLIYDYLKRNNIEVSFFIDSNRQKCDGENILHYMDLKNNPNWDKIIIGSTYEDEILKNLSLIDICYDSVIKLNL